MYFVFVSSYANTRESLGELEKAVGNTRLRLVFPQHFSFSQTSTRVLYNSIQTRYNVIKVLSMGSQRLCYKSHLFLCFVN